MKKILSVALSTAMAFSMFASVAFGETATTPQQKFDALAAKGILNGYPDGQAHLEKDLTRAEFAKIVTKLFNLTEVKNKLSYKDKGYNAKNWAVPYIEAVTAANLMQGKDTVKGIFDYNGKVTVEEVATVLFRALKLEAPATTNNSASVWAKGYAQAVIDKGLVAASTNFKANASRSLVVETAYAVSTLTALPTVASAEALSPTSVLVTFSDKATTTVTLTTPLVAGVETTINFKYNDHDYTAKVTLAAPKVVSVTAPNSKQLVVKFNRSIDSSTIAETKSDVTTLVDGVVAVTYLGDAAKVNVNDANVVLGAEGTEATITFAGSEFLKGNYAVATTDAIKTTAGEKVSAFTQLLTVSDTTAPTIVSVSAVARTTTNKVTLKLSEPVNALTARVYVNGTSFVPAAGNTLNELVVTSGTLEAGKTYDVSVLNLADYAGNVINPNPTKTSVTVVSDTAAPSIASVTVAGENTLKVVFSKDMDANTLNGNIKFLNADGENKGAFGVSKVDGKTYTLTAPVSPSSATLSGTVTFNTSIRDYLGNPLAAAYSQAVTFTKDTVAPTVTSVSYGSDGLVVKFSENVEIPKNSSFTIINEANGTVAATPDVNAATSATVATYTISDATVTFKNVSLGNGTYSLRLPSGLVTDTSVLKNKLAASVTAFTIAATTTTDTNKPGADTFRNVVQVGTDQRVTFNVYDDKGLDLVTVRDLNNYTLGGKAIPAGSYLTLTLAAGETSSTPKTATVNIFVPSAAVSASGKQELLISNIKDAAGNVVLPVVTSVDGFVDGVAPTLASGVVSSDITTNLVLTFSEPVSVLSLNTNDLTVTVNGVEIAPSVITPLAPVGGFASKFTVSVNVSKGQYGGADVLYVEKDGKSGATAYNEIVAYTGDDAGTLNFAAAYVTSITVKVNDDATVIDASVKENKITTGTTITVK
ncbi:S-layer protein [Paenibacillus sabinae T27]|uniref:S-layer protein n=2 Tax=Paenibacillus sabinae TaxID=365617 RepID=X4ZSE3_9BACL|nr:S-layer protein [Paenibacillus sabinae T27]